MRILVTGANGQVGHELLRALMDNPPPQGEGLSGGGVRAETSSTHPHPIPPLEGEGARQLRSDAPWAGEIIPATRGGTLDSPHPPEEGKARTGGQPVSGFLNPSPAGRGAGVRVRACETVDLADFDGLTKALDRLAPDLIINAAAYTAVDRAEDEPDLAQRINGDAVGVLGAWAQRHGARVVHYSTDYVFDGRATRPYREDDAPHPVSVYGRSKLAGEIALRDSGARHLILRTAWVYAARGHNFLRTMLRLAVERDELRVVDDQLGAPTPARLIAEVTAQAFAPWFADAASARDGVYHLVASGQTSWCGFARTIFERARRAGLIERVPAVHAIGSADYPTRARRPAYSMLDTAKLRDTFGIALPDWQTALDGVIGELAQRG